MSNIYDVAKLAGVSKSTVSRVVNNNGSIKEDTRLKVEDAMRQLHYSPSYFAQGIRTGKTRTIALIIPDSANLFYNEIMSGIEEVALKHEYMVLLCNTNFDSERELDYVQKLQQRNIDGIIFCVYRNEMVVKYLYDMSKKIPMVFVDNPFIERPDVSSVFTDGLGAISEAIQYLHNKSCKRIGFIGIEDICNISHRYLGYKLGLQSSGLPLDPSLIYMAPYRLSNTSHFEIGASGIKQLLKSNPPLDGLVAATDMLATGALEYLLDHGYHVPGDIKIIGHDNIKLSTMVHPKLSTIAQPIREIGSKAAEILFKKIEEDNSYNKWITLNSTFIERDSS